jgi:GxxExxY protein
MTCDHTPLLHEELTGLIRQTAFEVHCYLGSGFLEKVYVNALANRLKKAGCEIERHRRLRVHDEDGTPLGDYFADLVIDRLVLLEVKAVAWFAPVHHAQTINYLKITGLEVGMLINFGAPRLQVKRLLSLRGS